MKKPFRLCLSFLCASLLLFSGCSQKKAVSMITFDGTFQDGSFNALCKSGLDQFAGEANLSYLDGFEQDEDLAVRELLSLKADLVCVIAKDQGYAVLEGARANPEQTYLAIDYLFPNPQENTVGSAIRSEEGSFLAGYVAASMSKTGKIGFVGGMDIDIIHAFAYGFQAGANYAAKEKGASVSTETRYVGSFSDRETGKTLSRELYEGGCDVIFQAAGAAGLGVIDEAKAQNKWVIGVDEDQNHLAPGQVIASVYKRTDVIVSDLARRFLAGEAIGGKNYEFGLKEDATGLSTTGGLIPVNIQAKVRELEEKIKTQQIIVPKTANS